MNGIYIGSRGSSKSISSYFAGLHKLYLEKKISVEDYVAMLGAARVMLLHQDYDETIAWMEEVLSSENIDKKLFIFTETKKR